jgi:endonuclease VIII
MPEGDTIYRSARALNRALAGNEVVGFETGLAHLARINDDTPIAGRYVEHVEARGKWLLIYFTNDLILVTHMLMSGSWHLYRRDEKWRMPRSRMRAAIKTKDWTAVAFNVPVAKFHTERTLARSSVTNLGPDLLSASFDFNQAITRLEEHAQRFPGADVASTLLNQNVLAGLGNVYKSEVGFAAGIHPFRKIKTLTRRELEKITEIAQRYLQANVIEGKGDGIVTYTGNRRTTGSMDREERLWVYRRQGQECRRCGTAILMQRHGTLARSTYWCPRCQPLIE